MQTSKDEVKNCRRFGVGQPSAAMDRADTSTVSKSDSVSHLHVHSFVIMVVISVILFCFVY